MNRATPAFLFHRRFLGCDAGSAAFHGVRQCRGFPLPSDRAESADDLRRVTPSSVPTPTSLRSCTSSRGHTPGAGARVSRSTEGTNPFLSPVPIGRTWQARGRGLRPRHAHSSFSHFGVPPPFLPLPKYFYFLFTLFVFALSLPLPLFRPALTEKKEKERAPTGLLFSLIFFFCGATFTLFLSYLLFS